MNEKDEAFIDHLSMLLDIADVKIIKLGKQLADKQKELYETQKELLATQAELQAARVTIEKGNNCKGRQLKSETIEKSNN